MKRMVAMESGLQLPALMGGDEQVRADRKPSTPFWRKQKAFTTPASLISAKSSLRDKAPVAVS